MIFRTKSTDLLVFGVET